MAAAKFAACMLAMSCDALGTVEVGAGGRLAICVGRATADVGAGVYVLSGASVIGGDIVGGGGVCVLSG